MKKMNKTLCMIAIATLALSMGSCGGSKNAASMKNESLVEMTISQQMAEDRPATRAWGEGTNFNQSFAKTYAETRARAAFARMLSSKVTTASRQANDAAQQYSSDGKKGQQANDQGTTSDAFAQQIADSTLPGLVVIKTDTYRLKDGQYHVYVCIEWQGSVKEMAAELADNYSARVKQLIPDEDRAKMEVRHEEFRKSVEQQLNRMRGGSAE